MGVNAWPLALFQHHNRVGRARLTQIISWGIFLFVSTAVLLLKYFEFLYFRVDAYDYGIFSEMMVRGSFFNQPEYYGHGVLTHFAIHFQPILVFYMILYRLFHSLLIPEFLDWAGFVLLGIEVFYFARKYEVSPFPAILFWAFSPIAEPYIFEAHPVLLSMPLILPFLYYMDTGNWKKTIPLTIGLFLIKENLAFVLFAAAYYAYITRKDHWKKYMLMGVFMMVSVLTVMSIVGHGYVFDSNLYSGYGHIALFDSRASIVVVVMFLAMGVLSGVRLTQAELLMPFIVFAPIILSNRPTTLVFGFHYYATVTPVIAWILLKNARKIKIMRYATITILIAFFLSPAYSVLGSAQIGFISWTTKGNFWDLYSFYHYKHHVEIMHSRINDLVMSYADSGQRVCLAEALYPYYVTDVTRYSNILYYGDYRGTIAKHPQCNVYIYMWTFETNFAPSTASWIDAYSYGVGATGFDGGGGACRSPRPPPLKPEQFVISLAEVELPVEEYERIQKRR